MVMRTRIGVLALQGDFDAHLRALARAGVEGEEVRYPVQFDSLDGVILPGGESTTHLLLLEERGIAQALRAFHARGGALFGTCAGAILVASGVSHPAQPSLGLIDIGVERNGYGRQRDSFEEESAISALDGAPFPMIFIRAPRIRRTGPGVETLASRGEEPVLVRENRVLAGTFHPELSDDARIHALFVRLARQGVPVTS